MESLFWPTNDLSFTSSPSALYNGGEEVPMTFQLGIVTDKGVILASDCLLMNMSGARLSYQSPKITVYKEYGFAYCSSGDAFCETFAEKIRQEIVKKTIDFADGEPMEVSTSLAECVDRAHEEETGFAKQYNAFPGRRPMAECMGGSTMLVFRGKERVALWRVNTLRPYPSAEPIIPGSCIVGGDGGNPAVFFPSRYFRNVPNTLRALLPLAVHAVLMAKSDYVDGLQVGVFSLDTFRCLDENEIKPYIEQSQALDLEILRRLTEK
jgi:hypothetical protein